jgi:hypothetical protein
VIHSFIPLS